MDIEAMLDQILAFCQERTDDSQALKRALGRIADGSATYADALEVAGDQGKILEAAFRKYLPEALQDGYLFRAVADTLVKKPVISQAKVVDSVAEGVQEALNESAGIGIRPITPKLNQDQLDGIITGICNEPYEQAKWILFDQVQNMLEGHVDDYVRENAEFHYQAGMEPTIERISTGKCCKWCDSLVGTYKYDKVRNRGNDVFRRHRNCHCLVLYNPKDGSGKVQNVHAWSRTRDPEGREYKHRGWLEVDDFDDRTREELIRRQNMNNQKWTDRLDHDNIKERESLIQLNLQLFGHKTGDYRRMEHGHEWEELSLKETINRFAKGSKPVKSKDKQKISYFSKDGKYEVKYDIKGDYFRIKGLMLKSKNRPYLDKNGLPVLNIKDGEKTRSATQEEYERATHFKNIDVKGGKNR